MGDISLAAIADAAHLATIPPDAKQPLHRPLPPAPRFDLGALGALGGVAGAIQDMTQAPLAMCGQSVLAAATLAIAPHYDVELPSGTRPLTGIFISSAESGERKSAVDRWALAPVTAIEQQLRSEYDAATLAFENEKDAYQAARNAAKAQKDGARAALDRLGPAPKHPTSPMILVADPSPEGLVMHLSERPWGGLFTAEGGILIGGHSFNDETRMRTGALLNVLWDGDPIRRRRVGTGMTFLPGRRCSAHVMMQPVVTAKLFGDDTLDGIGTLARCLVVAPESTIGQRLFRDASLASVAAHREYTSHLAGFLGKPPRTEAGGHDVLAPLPLRLHPTARKDWVAFHDAVEADLRDEKPLAPIRAFAAKMAEHAGRLAAVLAVYADPAAVEVSPEAMAAGIALAQHYARELLRLHGAAAVSPDLRLAARLLAWWQARPDPAVHLAQIYQRGPNAIGDARTARRAVEVLEAHGWVERGAAGTMIDGAPRREVWRLR